MSTQTSLIVVESDHRVSSETRDEEEEEEETPRRGEYLRRQVGCLETEEDWRIEGGQQRGVE